MIQYYTKTIDNKELELGIDIDYGSAGGLEEQPYGMTIEVVSAKYDDNDITGLLQDERFYFVFETIANKLID